MVTMSINGLEAVFCKRFTTPDSLMILPKNSIPSSGRAVGLMKVVRMRPTMGNMIFSVLFTIRGAPILMRRSSLVVNKRMMGGWITGTKAM